MKKDWFLFRRKPSDKPAEASVMNLPESIRKKLLSAQEAVSIISPGDSVFVGTACATPRTVIAAMEATEKKLPDLKIYHFLTDGAMAFADGVPMTRYKHRSFFVGNDMREAVKRGKADYIPMSIAQVPFLIESGRLDVDTALVQVSLPEGRHVSLGVSVDITRCVVRHARKVVAEINPNMPVTYGDTFVAIDDIDAFVWVDTPVTEYQHPAAADDVVERIARYVAGIIDDGATLQIGLGRIPNHMLKYLDTRRDLGVHSDVITDALIDLIDKGVVTGRKKNFHQGQIVTGCCMGSRRLYDLVHRNPLFSFHPFEYVCNPANIARNNKVVSVSQAFAVDLTGQVCADQFQGEFYGGVSTQPDFMRGAAASPGGKPIICLPSTTEDGQYSRIRPLLLSGEGVTLPRSEVHYIITEYGIAYLYGKSIQERALLLMEIAHPAFRQWLLEESRKLGYVRGIQKLKSKVGYPVEEERTVTLKNGSAVMIRPARASDVEKMQHLFYHMDRSDIFKRFFYFLEALPLSDALNFCNVDYDTVMAFNAVTGEREGERLVGSAMYVIDHATQMAEVAYMIRPEWQGTGLGGALQKCMVDHALTKDLKGFSADILPENIQMLSLIKKVSDNIEIHSADDVVEVKAFFKSKTDPLDEIDVRRIFGF
jgi:acyl-CoA hydrolase/RimJ/RimL family protein N-acetyltransferase